MPDPNSEPPAGAAPAPLGAGIDFSDPNSPLAPLYLRAVHVAAVGLLGTVFVLSSLFPLWHTDVWGHVRYGQWMAEHRRIPDREPFCPWWDGRMPFTQFYTWTQLATYGAYATGERLAGGDDVQRMSGGVEMLRLLHAALVTARFAILLAVFVRAAGSWRVALVGLVGVVALDLSNLAVFRPQTFAQVLFAALLWPLSRPVLSRRAVALIPLLLALWANGHGSFVVAFLVLGAVLAGRLVELVARSEDRVWPWRDPQTVRVAAALGLSVVAIGVLNPYGFDLYPRTLALAKHPSLVAAVGEWRPLGFTWQMGWHWVLMASLVVIAGTQLALSRPLPAAHLLLILGFGAAVALQNRFVIWWAIVVPWVLVPRWADLEPRLPARLNQPPGAPSLRRTVLAALLLFPIFMWSAPGGWVALGGPAPLAQSMSSGTPWELAREIRRPGATDTDWVREMHAIVRDRYPSGAFTGTIMATPMQGDFLMWALAPEVPVTYAHIHLFHPDYWEELGIVGRGEPGWADVLEKYRVNVLVIEAEYGTQLRDLLRTSKGWKVLLDETGQVDKKPEKLTRQMIAIRLDPL